MRTMLLSLVLVVGLVGGAWSQCSDRLEIECLQVADYPGNVCVTLRVTTCDAPFTAFGVDVSFPSDYMTYLGLEAAGTLTADWDEIDAAIVDGSPSILRIGGYDSDGFGLETRAALVQVCFELTADLPSGTYVTVDESSMVDDLEGYHTVDCRMPSIVPVEASTWGAVKALFE